MLTKVRHIPQSCDPKPFTTPGRAVSQACPVFRACDVIILTSHEQLQLYVLGVITQCHTVEFNTKQARTASAGRNTTHRGSGFCWVWTLSARALSQVQHRYTRTLCNRDQDPALAKRIHMQLFHTSS